MLRIHKIFIYTVIFFCTSINAIAQNPCAELTDELSQISKEKNTLAQTFSPKEGRFKIGLPPANPSKSETDQEQKSPVNMTRYRWLTLNVGEFEVSYYDSNRKLDDAAVSKAILDNLRDKLKINSGGELQIDKDITIRNFPGREVKIKSEKHIEITRLYLVGNRLYIVAVSLPIRLECALERATKVLDSFELVNDN